MGRGEESLLGPIGPARRKIKAREEERAPEQEGGDILFAPPVIRSASLYDSSPEEAEKKVGEIVSDIQSGHFYSLIQAVDPDGPSICDNPFFLKIFADVSSSHLPFYLTKSAMPKRAKGLAKEKKELSRNLGRSLLSDAEGIIRSEMSTTEKEARLEQLLKPESGYEDFLLTALAGQGPGRDHLVSRLRTGRFGEKTKRAELVFLLQGEETEEKDDIFQEIVCREAFRLMHRAKPYQTWPPALRYGTFHGHSSGKILHILNERGRTLCSDNREPVYQQKHITYGQWRDGKINGNVRHCSACRSAADPDLLREIEGERGDEQSAYFGSKAQEMVEELARDKSIKAEVRKAFIKAANPEQAADVLSRVIAPRVGEIMAAAAEDEGSALLYGGGGHIAWDDLDISLARDLEKMGYTTPSVSLGWEKRLTPVMRLPQDSVKGMVRSEDPLLKATTPEERKAYVTALVLAALEDDHKKRFHKEQEGIKVLNDACERFIINS